MKAEVQHDLKADIESTLAHIREELRKIEGLPGTKTLMATVFGAVITAVVAILAVLAFAGDRFDGGMAAAGALSSQATEQAATVARINANIEGLRLQVQTNAEFQASPGAGKAKPVLDQTRR